MTSFLDYLSDNNTFEPIEEDRASEKIIRNQIKDILDEATLETLNGVNSEAIVKSIHKDFIEELNSNNLLQPSGRYRLSTFIQKIPHGIIDKKATGIGATTLEIKSQRHSIIVLPTKKLAYSKFKWAENELGKGKVLYIGSGIGEFKDTTSKKRIESYLESHLSYYKKFLVVADSLHYLIDILGNKCYQTYFLMVDEIDILQTDSNYRPRLESVIDHYFKFNVKNRCIITATMGEFSNPLFQDECKFSIEELSHKKRNIRLLYVKGNVNYAVKEEIEKHTHEKILIAYNTVSQAKNIISMLDESIQAECTIMCSDSSRREAGSLYGTLNDDSTLPKRINFMTCIYFSGIDIKDNYHLITVSNVKHAHQVLSVKKITQIYGRCREGHEILSDTIIYNVLKAISSSIEDSEEYKKELLKKAQKVLDLLDASNNIQGDDKDLVDLFGIVREAISDKALENTYRGNSVPLIRVDINKKFVPAYLNIDFLIERKQLFTDLYISPEKLYDALIAEGHQVSKEYYRDNRTKEEKQVEKEIETNTKETKKDLIDRFLLDEVKTIKRILQNQPATLLRYLKQKKRKCSKEQKDFIESLIILYPFVETDKLLNYLYEIRHKNIKAYKSLHNTIMFWSLAEDHPLRINMREAFEIGQEYSPQEIHNKIQPIIKYHFHKTIGERASISLFKAYFEVRRPRGSYVVIKENPLNFEERKTSIAKNNNNLLEHFEIY